MATVCDSVFMFEIVPVSLLIGTLYSVCGFFWLPSSSAYTFSSLSNQTHCHIFCVGNSEGAENQAAGST